jgi:Ca2+-binding RTX toxin-like protein
MSLTTTYSLDFVKLLDLAAVDSATDVTPLFNGGFAGIGDLTGAFSNSRGTLFDAQGTQTGTVSGFTGSNGAIDKLSNGNLVIAGEDGDSIVFKIVSSVTGATVIPTVDLGLAGASNADAEAMSSDRFCIVSQRGGGIDVSIRNNSGSPVSFFDIIPSGSAVATRASVCGSNDGGAIVAWQQTEVGLQKAIWFMVVDPFGAQGARTTFIPNSSSIDRNVETIAIPGGFALLYEDWAVAGVPGPTVIRMTRYTDAGAFIGTTTVSGGISVSATHPSATLLQNGLLAVAYTHEYSADSDTFVSLVDPGTGSALAFRVVSAEESIGDDVDNPVIAAFGLGQLAVFHTNVTDGDADGEALQAVRTTVSNLASDTMIGDSLVDVMYGGAGFDELSGLGNDDLLFGGASSDTVYGGDGNDTLDGGAGNDRIDGGAGVDAVSYATAGSALYIDLRVATQANTGGLGTDVISTIENVIGGAFADVLIGNTGVNTLYGGAGADALVTVEGDDFAYGGLGDDYIAGRDGNDTLFGDDNNDVLDGGNGMDILRGNAGDDHIIGGADNDVIHGGDGVANTGDTGDRWLGGDGGDDFIYGNFGTDRLSGGTGNDTLTGGEGFDYLTGEAGIDTFVYNAVSDGSISEQIGDWQGGVDKLRIDASAFGGGLAAGALAANRLVIGTAANQAFGQFLYNAANGVLYWDADGTGAGSAVAFTRLFTSAFTLPPATLAAADFDIVA